MTLSHPVDETWGFSVDTQQNKKNFVQKKQKKTETQTKKLVQSPF